MIEPAPHGVVINVRAVPRASVAGIAGTRGDALLVRLCSPPVGGAANAELIDLMARTLGVPRSHVSIAGGGKNRSKRVRVQGVSVSEVEAALSQKLAKPVNAPLPR